MLKSAERKGFCHVIYVLLVITVRYNCAKFHQCRICATDLNKERRRGSFCPPIHQQPWKTWISPEIIRKTTVYGFLLEVTFGDNLLVILVNPFSNPFSNPLVKVGEDLLNVKLKVIPKILWYLFTIVSKLLIILSNTEILTVKKMVASAILWCFNPFDISGLFMYLLKTLENQSFSDVFRI